MGKHARMPDRPVLYVGDVIIGMMNSGLISPMSQHDFRSIVGVMAESTKDGVPTHDKRETPRHAAEKLIPQPPAISVIRRHIVAEWEKDQQFDTAP